MTAACIFNEEYIPILKIFEVMGCRLGSESLRFAEDCDNARVRLAGQRSSEASKEARIARKEARSIEDHNYDEAEGILYAPGIAD
ncbi:Mutator-like transposase domain-containing protein [Camponotus japonicus]